LCIEAGREREEGGEDGDYLLEGIYLSVEHVALHRSLLLFISIDADAMTIFPLIYKGGH